MLGKKFSFFVTVLPVKVTSRKPWTSTTDVSVPATFPSKVLFSIVTVAALMNYCTSEWEDETLVDNVELES